MDFLDPVYREIAVGQFRKILALGAAEFLYDEVPTNDSVGYNFAPGHGYNPLGCIYAGDEPLARQAHDAADSVNRRASLQLLSSIRDPERLSRHVSGYRMQENPRWLLQSILTQLPPTVRFKSLTGRRLQ